MVTGRGNRGHLSQDESSPQHVSQRDRFYLHVGGWWGGGCIAPPVQTDLTDVLFFSWRRQDSVSRLFFFCTKREVPAHVRATAKQSPAWQQKSTEPTLEILLTDPKWMQEGHSAKTPFRRIVCGLILVTRVQTSAHPPSLHSYAALIGIDSGLRVHSGTFKNPTLRSFRWRRCEPAGSVSVNLGFKKLDII